MTGANGGAGPGARRGGGGMWRCRSPAGRACPAARSVNGAGLGPGTRLVMDVLLEQPGNEGAGGSGQGAAQGGGGQLESLSAGQVGVAGMVIACFLGQSG